MQNRRIKNEATANNKVPYEGGCSSSSLDSPVNYRCCDAEMKHRLFGMVIEIVAVLEPACRCCYATAADRHATHCRHCHGDCRAQWDVRAMPQRWEPGWIVAPKITASGVVIMPVGDADTACPPRS